MRSVLRPTAWWLVVSLGLVVAACGSSEAATQEAATTPPASPARAEVTLAIDGMACDACAGRITKALRDVDGVHEVSVEYAEKRARVVYDPARVTASALVETVDTLGFESRVEPAPGGR